MKHCNVVSKKQLLDLAKSINFMSKQFDAFYGCIRIACQKISNFGQYPNCVHSFFVTELSDSHLTKHCFHSELHPKRVKQLQFFFQATSGK